MGCGNGGTADLVLGLVRLAPDRMGGADAGQYAVDDRTARNCPVLDESGALTDQTEERIEEWDNSEYCVSGAITDHRDGTVSIKMGKATEAEALRAQLADAETAAKILLGEEK